MRQGLILVFDEVISSAVIGDASYITRPELSGTLAVPDQMGIQVIVDDATVSGGLAPSVSVWVETSADGVYWATKSTLPEVAPFPVTTNSTTISPYSADTGVLPNLGFVRLRITLTAPAAPASAHIKVYVTLRDSGGELVIPHPTPTPVTWNLPKPKPKPVEGDDKPENPHIYHGKEQP